jgi:HAD superfamily hydrolase (TIGR01549 family)
MDINSVKTIFFDVGDTLYTSKEMEDSYPNKLYELISSDKNVSLDEAKKILKNSQDSLEGKIPHVTKVAAMSNLGYSRAQVHEAFCKVTPKEYLKEDSKLDAILENLSKKYSLGIISNFKCSHLTEILDSLKININSFSHFVTEENVTNIKPDKEPFLKAIELSTNNANECVYVADSISKDLKPAKSVGMNTIWINKKPLHADQIQNVDVQLEEIYQISGLFN